MPKILRVTKKDCAKPGCPNDQRSQVLARDDEVIERSGDFSSWHMRVSANVRSAPSIAAAGKRMQTRAVFKQRLNQPQFQIGPIGVRVQQGPKLPPL
ncbi:hypothetical protein ACVWVY_008537 [Bradyrhizobium sp. URHC0002]